MASSLNKYDNLALEASAGTGKTFQLAMRVAGMLLTGVAPRDILCLTFTKKATAEMKERIIKFINSMAENTASESEIEFITPLMKKYAKQLKVEFSKEFIQEKAIIARNNLFTYFSELNIKTIDSFNNTILRIFPFEAGFRPDFNIESDDEIDIIKKEAFDNIIANILDDKVWKEILEKLYSVFNIAANNFIPWLQNYTEYTTNNILNLEITMQNAPDKHKINEMLNKILELRNNINTQCIKFMHTFEADELGINQLKTYEKLNTKKIDEIACNNLIKVENLSDAPSFKKYDFSQNQYNIQKDIRDNMQKYYLLQGDIITGLALNLGGLLYEKMKEIKKERNILTYSDISEEVYYMLSDKHSQIDKDYLYFRLDGKINHLLIDEFQDTSISQWLTLKPLAEEAMAGLGQKDKIGSFFYVGDPKQNIYRFRGGSSSLFRTLLHEYKDKLQAETLNTNYRSGSNIVEFVNNLSNNIYKSNKELFSIFNIDQKAYPENGDGYVEVTHALDEKKYYLDYTKEKIEKCIKAGYTYKDIAVLTVSNKHGGDLIDYLEENNIPVQVETSSKLTSCQAFQILSALAVFIETGDTFSYLTYALSHPKAYNNSFIENKENIIKDMNRIKNYIKNMTNCSIFEKILYLINTLDLQSRFSNNPDFYAVIDVMEKGAYGEKNINLFMEKIYKAAADKQSSSSSSNNAVTIMTIHKSKGLQFPVVVIPNLEVDLKLNAANTHLFVSDNKEFGNSDLCSVYKKDIHTYISGTKAEDYMNNENNLIMQDNINMLYVAMTRAEQALFMNIKYFKDTPTNISQYVSQFIVEDEIYGKLKPLKKEKVTERKSVKINVEIEKEKFFGTDNAWFDTDKKETQSYEATLFGSCLHAGLNILEYKNDATIKMAEKHMMAHFGALLSENNMNLICEYIKKVYNNTAWQKLFTGRVFKERRIGENNTLYAVDIYSELDDKIILMDYKTGFLDNNRINDYSDKLRKYANILRKIYNKQVETYIFHIESNQVILTQ